MFDRDQHSTDLVPGSVDTRVVSIPQPLPDSTIVARGGVAAAGLSSDTRQVIEKAIPSQHGLFGALKHSQRLDSCGFTSCAAFFRNAPHITTDKTDRKGFWQFRQFPCGMLLRKFFLQLEDFGLTGPGKVLFF